MEHYENSVNIFLYIQDVNDNFPVLKEPFYSTNLLPTLLEKIFYEMAIEAPYYVTNLSISYKVPQDCVIIQLKAEDKDIGDNAKLSYSLHRIWSLLENFNSHSEKVEENVQHLMELSERSFMSLNRNTGVLSITRQLLLDDIGTYILYVIVRDHGNLNTDHKLYYIPQCITNGNTSKTSSSSINFFNTNEYDTSQLASNDLSQFSRTHKLFKKPNRLLLITVVGSVSTLLLIVITITILCILFRIKFKSTNTQTESIKLDEIKYDYNSGNVQASYNNSNLSTTSITIYNPYSLHNNLTNSQNDITSSHFGYKFMNTNESIYGPMKCLEKINK
ncbi:unnamed protein product [Heterobilharzia americana]|nr:unnamed protein product [Heterobilharzia americana]